MSWLEHPSYVPVRDSLISRLRRDIYAFRRTRPIVLICGGRNSPNRSLITKFLRANTNALAFYAEDVWFRLAEPDKVNALKIEAELASLSDMVLILVESAGTCAELGAFAISSELRKKILPILDLKYQNERSFINTGPLRWIDRRSIFAPAIFSDFTVILTCSSDLNSRFRQIPPPSERRLRTERLLKNKLYLLIFICELVAILSPVSEIDLAHYINQLIGTMTDAQLNRLLVLAISLGLIHEFQFNSLDRFYYRHPNDHVLGNAVPIGTLNFSAERARVLDVLQRLPASLTVFNRYESFL